MVYAVDECNSEPIGVRRLLKRPSPGQSHQLMGRGGDDKLDHVKAAYCLKLG